MVPEVGRRNIWECKVVHRIQVHPRDPERVHRFLELFIDGCNHIFHEEDDLVRVRDYQVALNLFLCLVLLLAVAISLILGFHELDIELLEVNGVHECLLHWSCWSEVVLKLRLPLKNQGMDVGKDHQRIIKIKNSEGLAAVLRSPIAERDIRETILHVPKEGRISFLALDKAGILLYRIFGQRVKSCLGQHLISEIWCFNAQLFDECLLPSS